MSIKRPTSGERTRHQEAHSSLWEKQLLYLSALMVRTRCSTCLYFTHGWLHTPIFAFQKLSHAPWKPTIAVVASIVGGLIWRQCPPFYRLYHSKATQVGRGCTYLRIAQWTTPCCKPNLVSSQGGCTCVLAYIVGGLKFYTGFWVGGGEQDSSRIIVACVTHAWVGGHSPPGKFWI